MGKDTPCKVHKCKADEVPEIMRKEKCADGGLYQLPPKDSRDIAVDFSGRVPSRMPVWDEAGSGSWGADDEEEEYHVDLTLNPESNTYYAGDVANRIWRAVYQENCFKQAQESEMCVEERLFYRLVSGLHASISVHIAANFHITSKPGERKQFRHQLEEFERRIEQFPDRIRNMYTTYLFVARSISKVKDTLAVHNYSTGHPTEDELLVKEMDRLLNCRLLCMDTFDEAPLFNGGEVTKTYIKQMQEKMANITRLMDCLTCEKCRLWGKVQTLGLGTALRIVMTNTTLDSLQRSEVVALINLFRQLSYSVNSVDRMRELLNAERNAAKAPASEEVETKQQQQQEEKTHHEKEKEEADTPAMVVARRVQEKLKECLVHLRETVEGAVAGDRSKRGLVVAVGASMVSFLLMRLMF
eukprot:PhM_4_TR12437/c0_g2_i1/m.30365/K10950/ERO1L; ERO1-like protein alpha